MFVGAETDRLAIRELIDSYSHAVMSRDADAYISMWASDGCWRFRDMELVGHGAILSTWTKAMAGFSNVMFMAVPGSIKVDGNSACAVTYTFEHLDLKDGQSRFQTGRYDDELKKMSSGWKFTKRTFAARELRS